MVIRQQQEQAARDAQKAAAAKAEAEQKEPESGDDSETSEKEPEQLGEKVIVIHPGSQNLRVGLASDALPKSIPNVIARLSELAEFEENEPSPKRIKDTEADVGDVEPFFGEDVGSCPLLLIGILMLCSLREPSKPSHKSSDNG